VRLKATVRNSLAFLLRTLPPFKGKWRVGLAFQAALLDARREGDCVVDFRMRDGTHMRIDLRSAAERTAFWTGEYDRDALRRITAFLRPGAVVLDVGANVGFYSVALGARLRPLGGKVFAFEPVPANFRRLVEVIRRNGLAEVVHPLNLALGAQAGDLELAMDCRLGATSGNAVALCGTVRGTATARAHVRPLDEAAAELGIRRCQFIKIDIEGGEHGFFQGGLSFLRQHRPVIFCELNAQRMGQFGWTFEDLVELLAPLGYRVYRRAGRQYRPATAAGKPLEDVFLVPADGPHDEASLRRLLA
jgi:FkbM family methyltransferase